MSLCCPYQNKCKSPTYPHNRKNCGLYCFLDKMNEQRQRFSKNPADLSLINELEDKYLGAWNRYDKSKGKGPATGKAFEDWVADLLQRNGKDVEKKGKVNFHFGEFQVDAAIPSFSNPQIILEIKVYTDIQHSLMLEGLIRQLVNPNTKIGLVTLYEPRTTVINILNGLKNNFTTNKFDYFHVQNGWSNEIKRLLDFC